MLTKFKKIKDKAYFYQVLAKRTGLNPHSIQNNWFKKLFCSVPKPYLETTAETIDTMHVYEKEYEEMKTKLKIKYFGI